MPEAFLQLIQVEKLTELFIIMALTINEQGFPKGNFLSSPHANMRGYPDQIFTNY